MTPHETSYREISLTQGQVALVDASDYEAIAAFSWYASWDRDTKSFYAFRNNTETGSSMSMHRQIMGLTPGDPNQVDHREPQSGLDNRRCNLRVATQGQNNANRRGMKNNTSGYRGVAWKESRKMYRARITVDKKQIHLGYYHDPAEAHLAYCSAAKIHFGEFARLD